MQNIANPRRGQIDDWHGKQIIFKMIKGLDDEDKFDLESKNISDFRNQVDESSHSFCFGSVLFNMPASHDKDREVL